MAANATARTAWQTALSRGPGYEELPLGGAVAEGGYYVDYSAKTRFPAPSPADAPIALIQWALGWNERAAGGGVDDLAKPIYHRFHATPAEVMARLTGHPEFVAAAERWRRHDTAGHRVLALAQKAAFVATRR